MVNRILIRIKVVQMLYSYLLTRGEFKIDTPEDTDSKEKKFAYAVYCDLLNLITELSGYTVRRSDGTCNPRVQGADRFQKNKVGNMLRDNGDLQELTVKGYGNLSVYDNILQQLADKIDTSAAWRDFKKLKANDIDTDVRFWQTVLRTVIVKDPDFIETLRGVAGFSLTALNAGLEHACRTLASYEDSRLGYKRALDELNRSLDQAYELYHSMFALIIELTRQQAERIEAAKAKFLATPEELNPNMRFVENALARRLSENASLQAFLADHPVNWAEDPVLIKSLLDAVTSSEIYENYMSAPSTDYAADCEFWRSIMRSVILPGDDLAEALEAKSVYWNDDLPIMGTFVLKTIRHFAASPEAEVDMLPQYKDDEDAAFGPTLFRLAVENRETYRSYIDRFINSSQWDPERLAFMDIVIMITAIAELVNYPAIPVPVTMNEYIEIANCYSTSRSGQFINGILFSVVKYLSDQGIINKDH